MKVAGFTFIRNAVKYDYPIKESIQSLLPLCDHVVVAIGKSEDQTEALIRSINSPKITILNSVWDDDLREGGKVLAAETNKAYDHLSDTYDWCIYLQGDELIHENDHSKIRDAMIQYKDCSDIEGLLFNYFHFWGNYQFVATSRKWYRREIRIIRQNKSIRSYQDAQGFRKSGKKLKVKLIDVHIYHYGWVRPPTTQIQKRKNSNRYWHSDEWIEKNIASDGEYDYSDIDQIDTFKGTHPTLMRERIDRIHWSFTPGRTKLSLKNKISNWIEKWTGYRIGEYKNYILKS